jgi:cell division control protein 7
MYLWEGENEALRSFTQYDYLRHLYLMSDCTFDATLPTLSDKSMPFIKVVQWAKGDLRDSDPDPEQRQAFEFLDLCMELDPNRRVSAEEALQHPFLSSAEEDQHLDDEIIFA